MMMEYSAAGVKYLLWYVETKETAKLMQTHNWKEIHQLAIEENIYQQKATARAQSEFGCIKKRLEALPEDLIQKMITADIQTAKIITFISCMMTDRLLFEMMHEVYRNKIHYGETNISDADFNIFIQNKREQSEKVESFSDATVKKLKQVYTKYMLEVGLISGKPSERIIAHPYIDTDVRMILMNNHMEQYLYALTGEA
ncbi:MAG: DUF1819 family protein [Blautia sp.]|uniref:DUF1819 family protein n=1 Tax=Blautia sp. TaxID=1955243 RepID=UPI0025860473|nr:DUF1819 family protein [Blautia sp.]MCI7288367.1 DUF1819 family protein [Blautia sp.]MDY4054021.1 DUF1819 family protein [Blautia sp.]